MSEWPYAALGCEPGADPIAIKRAYAKKLKSVRPDDDPEGYQALRHAYEVALEWAYQNDDEAPPAREPMQLADPISAGHVELEPRVLAPVAALAVAGSALRADAFPPELPIAHDAALAEQRAHADDQKQRVARIRATLAEVDRIAVAELPAWWKRLEPEFALVPLAHRDALSRQMARFVAERPGFPDWLIECFAATFEWDRDFRRAREVDEVPALRERLAGLRAKTAELLRRSWRLSRIDEMLASGKSALALALALLFAPRLHEHFADIGSQRWTARFKSAHRRTADLLLRARLVHGAVAFAGLFLVVHWLGPVAWSKVPAALCAGIGIYALATAARLFDLLWRSLPQRLVGAWKTRFALGGAAILGAVALGAIYPEERLAVIALVIAAFALTYSGARWRAIWLPLCFAPAIVFLCLGVAVPAWVIWMPGILAFGAHCAMNWRPREVLGFFRLGFSDLNLSGGTIFFLIIGFKLVVPLLVTVAVLSLPLIVAVQARSLGLQHALRVIALASTMTVLTTAPDVIAIVWLLWLGICLLLGLLAVLSSAAIAEKLIRRQPARR